ncbi:MAG: RluA family pseudouridine synthase [Bacteroidales bacterium]|nr:RluA family pseudouridine synthase [Bacteroidales bacterium]
MINRKLTYTVGKNDQGLKLVQYLQQLGFSQKLLAQLKQKGLTVNGSFHRLIDPLQTNDLIEIIFAAEKTTLLPNPNLSVSIVYEDADLIIFDKPTDLPIHACARQYSDALGNYFTALFPNMIFRPIGRLDRHTSGLCLVAKHALAAAKLTTCLQKTYYAVVQGSLPLEAGCIDIPLIRVSGPVIRQAAHPEGHQAITKYEVIKRLTGHTLVKIHLVTGRTHQIRAHFAYLGFPLAGDALYGGSTIFISRQALHCGELSFIHPISNQTLKIDSVLPPDIQKLF